MVKLFALALSRKRSTARDVRLPPHAPGEISAKSTVPCKYTHAMMKQKMGVHIDRN